MTKLDQALLATLLVAERWMKETIAACEAENETTLLPQSYPEGLKTVRKAIRLLRSVGDGQ